MEFGLTEEQKLIQRTAREFADAKLALSRPRHLFHAVNLRRLLAEREGEFAFAAIAANAHAGHLAGRASAQPALEIARHFRAVEAGDGVAFAKSHLRRGTRKIECGDRRYSGGIALHAKAQGGALFALGFQGEPRAGEQIGKGNLLCAADVALEKLRQIAGRRISRKAICIANDFGDGACVR